MMKTEITYYEDSIREALQEGCSKDETVGYILEFMPDDGPSFSSYDVERYVIELKEAS